MSTDRRYRTLAYKRAKFHAAGPNLKQSLDAALGKLRTVGRRKQVLSADDEPPLYHVVGQHQIEQGITFGALMAYAPGTAPMALVEDDQATELTLTKLKVPRGSDGKLLEILDAVMFFGVMENHLVLMQSGLRSKALEGHLNWLLQRAKVIEGTNALTLDDTPPVAVRRKIEKAAVRQLQFGGDLSMSSVSPAAPSSKDDPPSALANTRGIATASATKAITFGSERTTRDRKVMEMLRELLGPSEASRLRLDELAGSNLEYKLQIRYREKTNENGQRLLDSLGRALRHADDVDTEILLTTGGRIKAGDLKLSSPVRITLYDGQPSASEVYEEIRQWMASKIHSGDIER